MHDKIKYMGLRVGLKINAEKTKAMKVSRHSNNDNNSLRCEDARYEYADDFAYLGTLITTKNEVGKEIQTRIMKGNRCAAALNSLLKNKNLSRKLKIKIYNAIIRPVVLYGCETWTMTLSDQKNLMSFENKILKRISGMIRDSVTGEWRFRSAREVRELTGQPYITSCIRSRRLAWVGHVVRADEDRAISRIYEAKPIGRRPPGRPRQRWMDNITRDLEELGAQGNWNSIARDRTKWRGIIEEAKTLEMLFGHRK